jgi:[ribosomal protein S18]-alanine N-acetyltransferase
MMFRLRPARSSDVGAIFALDRATEYAPHWPLPAYSAIVDGVDTSRCLILAYTDDTLAGFGVGVVHSGGPETGELESVVVCDTARRGGIGRALCVAVIDWCGSQGAAEIVLEVRAASAGAICLYAGLGFRETGRRPRYYRNPEDDAVLMRLQTGSPDPLSGAPPS